LEDGKTSITWTQWWVPSRSAIRGTNESGAASWFGQSARAETLFEDAVRGVDPFPAPTLTAATIGGRKAADPASYARLLDPKWRLASDWSANDWRRIHLFSDVASPWTDGKNVLLFSRRKHALMRDSHLVYKVPGAVARRLAAGRSLRVATRHRQVAIAAAGLVVLAVAVGLRRRRS
jgi:hypothetical protein